MTPRSLHTIVCAPLLAALLLTLGASGRTMQTTPNSPAMYQAAEEGAPQSGIRALSGGDGVTIFVTRDGIRCLTTQPGTTPVSSYLYFQVEPAGSFPAHKPLYATVEYFDDSLGTALGFEYDSGAGEGMDARYRRADDQSGGEAFGSHKWRKAIFQIQDPGLERRQNLGADFRLSGTRLFIRSITLTTARPADWDAVANSPTPEVKPLVQIGAGGQLIVGGFDPARVWDAAPQSKSLDSSVPALLSLGVTSHEGYVRWNLCEPEEGRYDWSVYDRFVQVYKKRHLKWVPFLIIGSPYSLPDWYYKKPGSQGYVCLEHGQETDVQSLWNPVLRGHVARFIKAFCDHYRPSGVIESILLGVTGNYGEAIYPATGNDWTADIHGTYHTHPGYWAGDPFARADFRLFLTQKYHDAARLNAAWGRSTGDIETTAPFARREDAPSNRAWLDYLDWYIGSMTRWARFWLQETRKDFPKGDIYLCTGGHAPPQHGSDFAEQCKAAAASGAGVRITNEGSDYANNFSLTRWVASSARQYGAYFSFEPAGDVNTNGVAVRIYNATASGARGLHYYYPNLYQSDAARDNFVRYGALFRQRSPRVEIAVYYPETWIRLTGSDFLKYVRPLRDRFDFSYLSDSQIADGGLKQVKALVLLSGSVAEESAWRRIADWVKAGGVVLYPEEMGALQTVEGAEAPLARLLAPGAETGLGRALRFPGKGDSAEYRDWVTQTLAAARELSSDTRAMLSEDGKEDGLFATVVAPGELLWLNTTAAEVRRPGVTVPPFGIATEKLSASRQD